MPQLLKRGQQPVQFFRQRPEQPDTLWRDTGIHIAIGELLMYGLEYLEFGFELLFLLFQQMVTFREILLKLNDLLCFVGPSDSLQSTVIPQESHDRNNNLDGN